MAGNLGNQGWVAIVLAIPACKSPEYTQNLPWPFMLWQLLIRGGAATEPLPVPSASFQTSIWAAVPVETT